MEGLSATNGWEALILTVIGAAVLKIVEWLLNRTKQKSDETTQYRAELRHDVEALKEQAHEMQTQLDGWREKYYETRDELSKVKAALEFAVEKTAQDKKAQAEINVENKNEGP